MKTEYNCIKAPSNILHKFKGGTIQLHNGIHYIVFPSSRTITDWILDFIFPRVPVPFLQNKKITAHSGFIHYYNRMRHTLYPLLVHDYYHIVGYSMGACVGYLCALDLSLKGYNISFTAFDPLRIGNKHFRDFYKAAVPDTHTITYGNSTVFKLPPYLLGYRHSGQQVHYGPKYKWWKYKHTDHQIENLEPFI